MLVRAEVLDPTDLVTELSATPLPDDLEIELVDSTKPETSLPQTPPRTHFGQTRASGGGAAVAHDRGILSMLWPVRVSVIMVRLTERRLVTQPADRVAVHVEQH